MSIKHMIKVGLLKSLPLIGKLIPVKKGQWVFGAWTGRLYADNSKYLFEYINTQHPEIEAVWITKEPEVVEKVRSLGYKVCLANTLKGMWTVFRAEVAFESEGEADISEFLDIKRTKTVQLWHGVAGKAGNWKRPDGTPVFSDDQIEKYNTYFWMASSEKYIEMLGTVTGARPERFHITGYPRNDTFVSKPKSELIIELRSKYPDKKLILYMPTHRNFGKESISIEEFYQIDQRLRNENIIMVYKPHFHELKNVLKYENDFTNIILAKEQAVWGDVYSYLHDFDLLISDYSSVGYDFLCARKPIVLFPFDLEHFKQTDAGIWDEYEAVPAGPFCFTWDEVLDNVSALLEEDSWRNKREACRLMFHPYDDGKNCERVYNEVINWVLK